LISILAPLDGTDLAEVGLAWAQQAASRCGASLHLLSVVDTSGSPANGHAEKAAKYLQGQADAISGTGVGVQIEIATGSPADEILRRATSCDLTVMTYHTSKWLFGGALDSVLQRLEGPIVIVRSAEGRVRRSFSSESILVPLDDSSYTSKALPAAIGLAEALGATLTLCTVIPPVAGWFRDAAKAPPAVAQVIEEKIATAHSFLGQAGYEAQNKGIQADTAVAVGDPHREIIRIANETGAGLIAMATRGNNGLSRLLGSVALAVAQSSPIPCLLVHPSDTNGAH